VSLLKAIFAPMSYGMEQQQAFIAKHSTDVFEVTGPHGKSTVTGYMRCELSSGILTFRNADDMVVETFGPGGWWHLVKVGPL
jgi:hypothetical protein